MTRSELELPAIPSGRPNLIITGFMASGKTTVGRLAAQLLEMPFFDLDTELELAVGERIPDLLGRRGEPWFREEEAKLMLEASRLSGCVIATGGGAVLSPEAFAQLAGSGVGLVLGADPAELIGRAGNGQGRPMLEGLAEEGILRLLADRETAYSRAGEPLDTTGLAPSAVADLAVAAYRRRGGGEVAMIPIAGDGWQTDLVVGGGAVGQISQALARTIPSSGRAFVVMDSGLPRSSRLLVPDLLRQAGWDVSVLDVAGGEPAKTLASLARVWSWLLELSAERHDVLFAVGGGAVLDAAGFAAATFARGIAHVNVPTTVLAMADAALGGKTAINHDGVKNPVGAFRHPVAVIADPHLLGSMDRPGARDGLAEVIKSVTLGARLVVRRMAHEDADPAAGSRVGWLIEQAIRIKAGYVAADPAERGLRAALNLGHTYAHGLEAASGYEISHGEAVALGLLASASLGASLEITPNEVGDLLRRALTRARLPASLPYAVDPTAVAAAMGRDKKREASQMVFLVPGVHEGVVRVDDVGLDTALEHLWELQTPAPSWVPHAADEGRAG